MPLTLLVDEISPDRVRATVSHPGSIYSNIHAFLDFGLIPAPLTPQTISGIYILPTGKYVCLIVKASDAGRLADGMVFLDLTDRGEYIEEIARKFGNARLEKKFLETVEYINNNPDTHTRFLLSINTHDFYGT